MTAETIALVLIAALVALGSSAGAPPAEPPPAPVEDDLFVLGYYMQDNERTAWTVLEENRDALTGVSPWSWGLTREGDLRPVYFNEGHLADVLDLAGSNGLQTHVLIHNFDPDLGRFDTAITDHVLTGDGVRKHAIERITNTATSWGVSGVHIDFEGVAAERRDDLTAFMAALRDELPADIELSIAVAAKTFATAEGLWTRAYDYESLADYTDFLMIMAYDQHWPGGAPGPVAASPWVRSVIEYALDAEGGAVPPEKIVLGVPGYGYDWPLSAHEPGESVTFAETSQRLHAARLFDAGVEVRWHDEHLSPYFDYDGRRIWFENADSLHHKLQLAREYNLHGVALWRIGQEDPELWSLLRAFN